MAEVRQDARGRLEQSVRGVRAVIGFFDPQQVSLC
jgi:hypothetical protein